jgi:hypothetical protein
MRKSNGGADNRGRILRINLLKKDFISKSLKRFLTIKSAPFQHRIRLTPARVEHLETITKTLHQDKDDYIVLCDRWDTTAEKMRRLSAEQRATVFDHVGEEASKSEILRLVLYRNLFDHCSTGSHFCQKLQCRFL